MGCSSSDDRQSFCCTLAPGLDYISMHTVLTLAQLIEELMKQGKSCGDSIRNCFTSVLEVSIRLKEMQDGKDEQEDDEAENDDDEDEDSDNDDEDDYEEDSKVEEYEETEEEFLHRYDKAAEALENGSIIEEGNDEDQELETELGLLRRDGNARYTLRMMIALGTAKGLAFLHNAERTIKLFRA